MLNIALELLPDEAETALEAVKAAGVDAQAFRSNGFDASSIVTLIIELSPNAIGLILAIYAVNKRAKKHVSLKFKGMEVSGVSEETLLKLIEKAKK